MSNEQEAMKSIFAAVDEAEQPADDLHLAREPRNDLGNARRLIARYGNNLMWVDGARWYVWDGRRWQGEAGDAEAMKCAHRTAEAISGEVKALEVEFDRLMKDPPPGFDAAEWQKRVENHFKWQAASGNSAKVDAMLRSAMPYLRRPPRELDDRPFLLNVLNGTLELPTKVAANDNGTRSLIDGDITLRPHLHSDLKTRCAEVVYDAEATCPLWNAFIARIIPDHPTQLFLQTWFGYVLTGDTGEQQMLIAHGKGANGKSTMMDTIQYIMGDYGLTLPIQTFMFDERRRGGDATPDLARLPGGRLVTASEPEVGQRLSESVVKQITGGEKMTARNLHESFFEFMPSFKLVLSVNIKPNIRGQDEGIWRRILLVPFDQYIPPEERDKRLAEKLKAEASGILNWLLDGYRLWRERGLVLPESVKRATEEYRTESDPVGEFMRTATVRETGGSVQATRLYQIYTKWAGANGISPVSGTSFGRRLSDLGYHKEKMGVMYYTGIAITQEEFGGLESSKGGSGADGAPDGGGLPDER